MSTWTGTTRPSGSPASNWKRGRGRGALPNIIYDDGNDRRQLRRRNGDGHEVLIRLNCVSGTAANTGEGAFHWY